MSPISSPDAADRELIFVSIISHALKAPISKVRWTSELLLGGDVGTLSPSQKEFLEQIHEQALTMNDTIALAVALLKIETGEQPMEIETTDVKALARETISELKEATDKKQVSIGLNPPGPTAIEARFDPRMVKQALFHLLANAIRYSPSGGDVAVDITSDAHQVMVSVRDHGIGIPSVEQEKVFNRFFRATNAKGTTAEGLGLGLFFTKLIVERWGGKIWFESQEGKGSTFHFTIPVVS